MIRYSFEPLLGSMLFVCSSEKNSLTGISKFTFCPISSLLLQENNNCNSTKRQHILIIQCEYRHKFNITKILQKNRYLKRKRVNLFRRSTLYSDCLDSFLVVNYSCEAGVTLTNSISKISTECGGIPWLPRSPYPNSDGM